MSEEVRQGDAKPGDIERSLDLLWSVGGRTGRGPQPKLSVAKIVDAAIRIADAEGLDALSMQRLAGEFGYSTMSLYRYVPGKVQLVDIMADVACGPAPDMSQVAGGWRAEVELWVDELWKVYQAHDWLVRVQIKNPPIGPNQLAWFEALLSGVSSIGLSRDDMAALAMFVSSAVRDLARFTRDLVPMGLGYAQVLENILETDRFPMVAALVTQSGEPPVGGDSDASQSDPSESGEGAVRPVVHFGVQRLLDGIEVYVAGKAAQM
ncbi:TetR/AcrR family transcriptional regulator [Streptomyces sp. 21So2-11]|uniref:TetR/AcrR family transcriptional regulator n=1 Tax=Streptomyces sp. 21So2-11 TaxID=3144408 RepID=UPI00321B8F0F